MTISFTSTYRVPFSQPRAAVIASTYGVLCDLPKKGTTPGQIDRLKQLAQKHGGIFPSGRSREGSAKFSVPKRLDEAIGKELASTGFSSYQIAQIHNVPQNQIVDALTYKGRFATLTPKV